MSQILLYRQAKVLYKYSKANLFSSTMLAKSCLNVSKKSFSNNTAPEEDKLIIE